MIDETFNAAVAEDGGELDASRSPNPNNRGILLYVRNILAATGNSGIYCGLIKNPQFNACAFETRDHPCIGLFSGALRVLLHASCSLLSHRDAFPSIGSPQDEVGDEPLSGGFITRVHSSQPRCPRRLLFARALFQFASTFIFCHEWGHLWAGHVKYLSKDNQAARLYESSPKEHQTLFAGQRQAIELDADRAAAAFSVGSLHDLGGAFESPTEAFQAWIIAMILVFQIMGEESRSVSSYEGSSHPHPWLRTLFVMTHALHEAASHTGQAKHELEPISLAAVASVRETWTKLSIPGHELYGARSNREGSTTVLYELSEELSRLYDLGISRCQYPPPDPHDLQVNL